MVTTPRLLAAASVAALLSSAATLPAVAQDGDCTAQIEAVQSYISNSAGNQDEFSHVQTVLAEAGDANANGDTARCLELVKEAKDEVGMRD